MKVKYLNTKYVNKYSILTFTLDKQEQETHFFFLCLYFYYNLYRKSHRDNVSVDMNVSGLEDLLSEDRYSDDWNFEEAALLNLTMIPSLALTKVLNQN
jgi:hypothetical protein